MPIPEVDTGTLARDETLRDTRIRTILTEEKNHLLLSLIPLYIYIIIIIINSFNPFSSLAPLTPLASLTPLAPLSRVSY